MIDVDVELTQSASDLGSYMGGAALQIITLLVLHMVQWLPTHTHRHCHHIMSTRTSILTDYVSHAR